MRLLNSNTHKLQWFLPREVPDYVILSHRWCTPSSEECTYEDVRDGCLSKADHPARLKNGYAKLEGACRLADRYGYDWIWIDSCCIDKSSSAELQEAINSMWKYYANSNICYVYMSDVQDLSNNASDVKSSPAFTQSEWFTRAWTLQELLAPRSVEFYSADWKLLCTKLEQSSLLAEITGIEEDALIHRSSIHSYNTAMRLSWASHRHATREEDASYALLGLFDIAMPLLYGEGRYKSFARLQAMIYNSNFDQSILLFRPYISTHAGDIDRRPLLADSLRQFCEDSNCAPSGMCLQPKSLRYNALSPTYQGGDEACEQIMPTATATSNTSIATLNLVKYHTIASSLKIPDDAEQRLENVTHVAVLNRTETASPRGALGLLISMTEGSNAAEILHDLVVIHDLEAMSCRPEKTRVRVTCKRAIAASTCSQARTLFTACGGDFEMTGVGIYDDVDKPLELHVSSLNLQLKKEFRRNLMSMHHLALSVLVESAHLILQPAQGRKGVEAYIVELARKRDEWFITAFHESLRPSRNSDICQNTLFSGTGYVDRCIVTDSQRKQLIVSLKHLPRARPKDFDRYSRTFTKTLWPIPMRRYGISIETIDIARVDSGCIINNKTPPPQLFLEDLAEMTINQ